MKPGLCQALLVLLVRTITISNVPTASSTRSSLRRHQSVRRLGWNKNWGGSQQCSCIKVSCNADDNTTTEKSERECIAQCCGCQCDNISEAACDVLCASDTTSVANQTSANSTLSPKCGHLCCGECQQGYRK
jgi:hypothetical protein